MSRSGSQTFQSYFSDLYYVDDVPKFLPKPIARLLLNRLTGMCFDFSEASDRLLLTHIDGIGFFKESL